MIGHHTILYAFSGFKSPAQKTQKHVQKVRGIEKEDCPDGSCSGGGVLPVMAPPPCGPPVGGVRQLPLDPVVLLVPGGGPLPGL